MLAQGVNDSFSLDDERSMFNIGRQGVTSVVTPSGNQEMSVLTEQGLYFFLGRSDKQKALPMQKWIAGDVLPAIRKKAKPLIDIDGINHTIQQNQQLDEKRRAQKKPHPLLRSRTEDG